MKALTRLAAVVIGMSVGVVAAMATDYNFGSLKIDDPWARPTVGSSKSSAAYMKIENSGDTPDRLISAKAEVAGTVMLHESRMDGDVMKMVQLSNGIEVPAHGEAVLKPLGLHIMLMGLTRPLKEGEKVPLTLVFEKQGEVVIDAQVTNSSGNGDGHDMHDMHGHH